MKIKNPLGELTRFELSLLAVSVLTVTLSFVLSPERDYLTLISSLVGVTALIFISKGLILGQVLVIVFAVFYGIVSFFFGYYGEMFTYLLLTAPAAAAALISWLRNPYEKTKVVKVAHLDARKIAILILFTLSVTVGFYFILKALGTVNLVISTVSVATSALGSALTVLRSPLYAIAYSFNDAVLITMWILATVANGAYLPMIFCFVMFLFNDLYGFVNWYRLRKRQEKDTATLSRINEKKAS